MGVLGVTLGHMANPFCAWRLTSLSSCGVLMLPMSSMAATMTPPPPVVLTSKLCPIGVESTVYALLAGFSNFGRSVGSSLGVLALDIAGIKTPKEGACNFDNLPLLLVISHVVLPLLTVPLTFVLIPKAKMTDDLVGGLPMMGGDVVEGKDGSDGGDEGSTTSDSNGEDGGERGGAEPGHRDVPPLVAPVTASAPAAADGEVPL